MAIDYTRRDRGRTQTAPPVPPVERARTVPLVERATTGVGVSRTSPQVQQSLRKAAAVHDALVRDAWPASAQAARQQADSALTAYVSLHADTRGVIAELNSVYQGLRRALQHRYPASSHEFQPVAAVSGCWTKKAAAWISAAKTLENDAGGRVPFTSKAQLADKIGFMTRWRELNNCYAAVIHEVHRDAWQVMVDSGEATAQAAAAAVRAKTTLAPMPPPPVGPYFQPCDSQDSVLVSELGPLRVTPGVVTPRRLLFRAVSGDSEAVDREGVDIVIEFPDGIDIPVILDLDVHGGFITDSKAAVQSVVLNLLAALPARQLMIRIFDPRGLGDSAKYLFGLGEVADKIIGDKVKTTERELDELLQEIEEHIAFVNQRYLQGEYHTLSSYNEAAGDVAEPYRLLLLYDFPHGFNDAGSRGNLDRLDKIIKSGRRAGVFVIVAADTATVHAPPLPPSDLPLLPAGGHLPPDELAKVLPLGRSRAVDLVMRPDVAYRHPSGAFLRAHSEFVNTAAAVEQRWFFLTVNEPAREVSESLLRHIGKSFATAGDIKVSPQRVADLQRTAEARRAGSLGIAARPVAVPEEAQTWWKASAAEGLAAPFGRLGAKDIAQLTLDDDSFGVLIGGRPGSGKSVLLHAIIMGIALRYDPSEVDLYLLDFKEGVEFKQYATHRLPHARVIAIESEREFGVAVLESLEEEMKRRGELFRAAGDSGQQNLSQYRSKTGQNLQRCVLIIDEFQQLFERADRIAARSSELLESLVRRGRAFGIHVLLASQTLSGMDSLPKHILRLIPTRIAMQSSEADSRLILGEDNPDAQLLSRSGEGILNLKHGQHQANLRFQAAFWSSDERSRALLALNGKALERRLSRAPVVFEGQATVDIVESLGHRAIAGSLPIGMPMTLDGPVHAELRREPGGNVLIVDDDAGVFVAGVANLAGTGTRLHLMNHLGVDGDWNEILDVLSSAPGVTVHGRRATVDLLNQLCDEIKNRHEAESYRDAVIVLAIAGLHRARELEADSYDDAAPSNVLAQILRDGPEVGVHVVAWCDKAPSLRRRLNSSAQTDFGLRVVGRSSMSDSHTLIDSDAAAQLKPSQAIYNDHDRSYQVTVRKFGMPPLAWIGQLVAAGSRGR